MICCNNIVFYEDAEADRAHIRATLAARHGGRTVTSLDGRELRT
jgi:hypothetical protein